MQEHQLLEEELARWIGVNDIIACSSGTAALHLAIEAMQLPKKSEVIIPDYTMIACALAVDMADMIPVTIDCNKRLLIDSTQIEDSITDKTRAIMAVHVYGRMCDMQSIHEIASKYNLLVIEDMAEAHGCIVHPNTHVACWSFYKNKVVAGEEGGCVWFCEGGNERKLIRRLRNMGFNEPHDYTHIPRGHNYRMSNAHAKIIRSSLKMYSSNLKKRRYIESQYDISCPELWKMSPRACPWVYDLRIPMLDGHFQNLVIDDLREEGIQARHGFKPISAQRQFRQCVGDSEALEASREVIYLPIDPDNYKAGQAQKAFTIIKRRIDRSIRSVI